MVTSFHRIKLVSSRNYHNNKGLGHLSAFVSNYHVTKKQNLNPTRFTTFIGQKKQNPTTLNYIPIKNSTPLSTFTSSSLSATSKKQIFQVGNEVQILDSNGKVIQNKGCIIEQRNGWYTVEIMDGSSNTKQVKKRASQIITITNNHKDTKSSPELNNDNIKNNIHVNSIHTNNNDGKSINNNSFINTLEEFKSQILLTEHIHNISDLPPTIIDIDAIISNQKINIDNIQSKKDIEYMEQCIEFTNYKKWVMFTDLHCSPASLNTCLHVLEKVYKVAKEREAGVLFLGDFWHHRGTMRVDCLNAVLKALSQWDVPMIMVSFVNI